MTESSSPEPTGSEPTFTRRLPQADRRRVLAVAIAGLAVIGSAAVTMGASPGPDSAGTPAASAESSGAPATDGSPGRGNHGNGTLGQAFRFGVGGADAGGPGIVRAGGVEITAISGADFSLETVDGWTRTIKVTSSTLITKGGDTIDVDDLAVGDHIRFRQQRQDDGTFTITRIDVVLPHVAGTVTAKTRSTITVLQRDGSSTTVHVGASTSFVVEGAAGTAGLDDVAAGMQIVASGEQNSDGSLDAARVIAGTGRLHAGRGWKKSAPDASPAPDGSADPG